MASGPHCDASLTPCPCLARPSGPSLFSPMAFLNCHHFPTASRLLTLSSNLVAQFTERTVTGRCYLSTFQTLSKVHCHLLLFFPGRHRWNRCIFPLLGPLPYPLGILPSPTPAGHLLPRTIFSLLCSFNDNAKASNKLRLSYLYPRAAIMAPSFPQGPCLLCLCRFFFLLSIHTLRFLFSCLFRHLGI